MKTVFRVRRWVGALWVAGLWCVGSGFAQEPTPWQEPSEAPFDFEAGRSWRGALPAPEAVLGYEVGEAYADYGAVLRLFERYRGSERLVIKPTGVTNERRPMHVLVISSPENLARLDAIKAANQRLVDGRAPLGERELATLVAQQPIIVWLGYNIHGDEAAGTEAAMQVLHTLLDDDGDEVRGWLRDVVVVMNPCQNPDGRERFVVWANAHGIGRAETFAYEKENPWNVQGRYNHYYFDLNRDMLALSQVESRNTAAAYLEWMPQVAADHHGETKEYFFPPAALPINPHLPREQVERWQEVFGQANAAAFDAQRWMYYVRDTFDVFYPGYWDSWPSLQGATGMTYETSGGGKTGFKQRRDDGSVMTLRQAIAKHYVASLATIRTAAAHREARLRDFHATFVSAVQAGRTGAVQQVFLPRANGDGPIAGILRRQGIEVEKLRETVTLPQATTGLGEAVTDLALPPGTLVVDLAQPRGHLARALLETHTPMDEAFVDRQLDKVARNRERGEQVPADDYEFYDQTAWSLPLMNGQPVYFTATPVDLAGRTVASETPLSPRAAAPGAGVPGVIVGATGVTAWVRPIDDPGAREWALGLLRRGVRVATAVRPFQADGQAFARGSFIVRTERNPSELVEWLGSVGNPGESGTVAVRSGFPAAGNTGIGSESTFALREPKVLLAAGEPVRPSSYGVLYHLLETLGVVDYVPVAAKRLGQVDLRGFNVVVLPSGDAEAWAEILGEEGQDALKRWVEQGGTLICLGGAAEFAAGSETGWTDAAIVGRADEVEGTDAETEVVFDERPLPIPGALLRARVDPEHFLSFGYTETELPYYADGEVFFRASATGTNVVTFADERLWIAGHIWPDNTVRLVAGTAAVIDEPVGEGHIILFSDEPGHRAVWRGSVPMLLNALLFAPGLRNEVGSYVR